MRTLRTLLAALLTLGPPALHARNTEWELDTNALQQALESIAAWADEHLDQSVFDHFGTLDVDKANAMLRELTERLQQEYVFDLAALRAVAMAALPVLEASEDTLPLAAWLRTRLDYLEAAEALRRLTPPPTVRPGEPPPRPPNPPPSLERKYWRQRLAQRPLPPAAAELVPKLKPIFARHGAPPQLVWLAEVESGFNRRARSPAGAAGLFQLMPATARQYGLRTWPWDQRYQPEPSARAAAQMLRHLRAQFGNWPLALAAYNAGPGRVQRLLQQHRARTFDAIAPRLPAETQMYVPRVEATLLRRENVTLDQLDRPATGS
ncbi:MAG: lytic transglycosylase domain-containing protein [Verrucomicrobiales bacterium]|nr:lytic transglycosylase domain-containing protein [Verrucomicrobiales bacterium]